MARRQKYWKREEPRHKKKTPKKEPSKMEEKIEYKFRGVNNMIREPTIDVPNVKLTIPHNNRRLEDEFPILASPPTVVLLKVPSEEEEIRNDVKVSTPTMDDLPQVKLFVQGQDTYEIPAPRRSGIKTEPTVMPRAPTIENDEIPEQSLDNIYKAMNEIIRNQEYMIQRQGSSCGFAARDRMTINRVDKGLNKKNLEKVDLKIPIISLSIGFIISLVLNIILLFFL